jgi:uncharacterized membrane protein SpoIIM required for sporulation
MTESQFINQNKEDWKELENLLEYSKKDADRLNELFVKVSSDLSYARTFYPKRMVMVYLNSLTQKVFESIQQGNKKVTKNDLIHFLSVVLPIEIRRSKNALLFSFFVFVICFIIGLVSTANNPEFAAQILGQDYIDITDANINSGDPMAIYKDNAKMNMFFGITFNNIKVAFLAFVLGIFGSLGSIIILIGNGVMVGVFQYYFYSKGLLLTSFLTIWIHGTIEISAIIIAGGAGIVLGNGLLFPGTFKKTTSLKISAKRALRILLSTVPLFIIAGALESFVTRLTEMPDFLKWFIILFSLVFIVFIYIIYPFMIFKSTDDQTETDIEPLEDEVYAVNKMQNLTFPKIINHSFSQFRQFAESTLFRSLPKLLLIVAVIYYAVFQYQMAINSGNTEMLNNIVGYIIQAGILIILSVSLLMYYNSVQPSSLNYLKYFKKYFIPIVFSILPLFILLIVGNPFFWLLVIVLPPQFSFILLSKIETGETLTIESIQNAYKNSFENFISYIGVTLFCSLIFLALFSLQMTGVFQLINNFFTWHNIFDNPEMVKLFTNNLFSFFAMIVIFPLYYIMYGNLYFSNLCKVHAVDLQQGLIEFKSKNRVDS